METPKHREFMKSLFGRTPAGGSDQSKGLPQPPLQLPYDPLAKLIELPKHETVSLKCNDFHACMRNRRSRRHYTHESLSLDELAFLLWATQGVQNVLGEGYATLRPVASGGARHPFETYIVANHIDGVDPGVYRYLPLSHELAPCFKDPEFKQRLLDSVFGQRFVMESAAVFVWSCVPYRGEWRYGTAAHKVMLMDAGHICQNLYLACEAIGAGTCAIGAYDQPAIDTLFRLDGENEFVVYLAPVGKIK